MGALTRTWLARPGRTTRRAMTARWWTSSRSAQMLQRLSEWDLEGVPWLQVPGHACAWTCLSMVQLACCQN